MLRCWHGYLSGTRYKRFACSPAGAAVILLVSLKFRMVYLSVGMYQIGIFTVRPKSDSDRIVESAIQPELEFGDYWQKDHMTHWQLSWVGYTIWVSTQYFGDSTSLTWTPTQAAAGYVTDWGMVNIDRKTSWGIYCSGIRGNSLGDHLMLAARQWRHRAGLQRLSTTYRPRTGHSQCCARWCSLKILYCVHITAVNLASLWFSSSSIGVCI